MKKAVWVLTPIMILFSVAACRQVPPPETPLKRYEIRRNETLESILMKKGSSIQEIHDLANVLKPFASPRKFREGQKISFRFAKDGKLEFFSYIASPAEIYEVVRSGEDFTARQINIPVDVRKELVSIMLTSSMYEDLLAVGESPELVSLLVDILAWDVDFFSDPREGDAVTLVVEKRYVGGDFYKYGRVISVDYDGEVVKQRAFYFDKRDSYYDEKGRSLARNFLKSPVKYSRISSGFGSRRHPITHRHHKHIGTDYVAPVGTPVWAMANGRIVKKSYDNLNGNHLVVHHTNGYETYYLHLSRFQKGMEVGRRVRQKEVIGYVGTTGRSSGPHLHLSIKAGRGFINPLKLKRIKQDALKGEDLALFKTSLTERLAPYALRRTPYVKNGDNYEK